MNNNVKRQNCDNKIMIAMVMMNLTLILNYQNFVLLHRNRHFQRAVGVKYSVIKSFGMV